MIRDRARPAQRDFATFLEAEYLPASRKALGARTLAGGEAYYRWLVSDHTTTSLTPDQIHDLGLSEVARIRAEMEAVKAEAKFDGDLAALPEQGGIAGAVVSTPVTPHADPAPTPEQQALSPGTPADVQTKQAK